MVLEMQNNIKDTSNVNLLSNTVGSRGSSVKITITPCQPKTLTHLPKRPPVDIAFSDLKYTVAEGRKKREYCFHLHVQIFICSSISVYLDNLHDYHYRRSLANLDLPDIT